MEDQALQQLLVNVAKQMATGLRSQALAWDLLADGLLGTSTSSWPPAAELPLGPERWERQALVLEAVRRAQEKRGQRIERPTWMAIADHYGYNPRGTAGFFRSDHTGLLILHKAENTVEITQYGLDRIKSFESVIKAHSADIDELLTTLP